MSLSDKTLTPQEVEALTGFGPELLRVWRSRGMLDGIGLAEGGRWKFSLTEAVALAVCTQLRSVGLDGGVAIKVAGEFSETVLRAMEVRPGRQPAAPRYLAIWNNSVLPSDQGQFRCDRLAPYATYEADSLEEINRFLNAPTVIVLDAFKVAACLPGALIESLKNAKLALLQARRDVRGDHV